MTGIPLSNFTQTSFKKYPLKKTYENFNRHFGTLALKLRKPGRIYTQVMGGIYALSQMPPRQGSSMVEQSYHKAEVVGSIPTPGTA